MATIVPGDATSLRTQGRFKELETGSTIFPLECNVTLGILYGPTGTEFTGTLGATDAANFTAQLDSDIANIFLNTDHFAEAITYTNLGEEDISVTCVWTDDKDKLDQDETQRSRKYGARIDIGFGSCGIMAMTPNKDKVVRSDGTKWTVMGLSNDSEASNGQGMITLMLSRSAKEKTGRAAFTNG